MSEGERVHLLCLCWQPCTHPTPTPTLTPTPTHPPTPHFLGYFSSKCCSIHCRGSRGGGRGGGRESSGKDGSSAVSEGLGCEFGGKVSLVGITELRVWRWDQARRSRMGEVRAQGLEEELPAARRSVTHGSPQSARLADNRLCPIGRQFKKISMKHIWTVFTD